MRFRTLKYGIKPFTYDYIALSFKLFCKMMAWYEGVRGELINIPRLHAPCVLHLRTFKNRCVKNCRGWNKWTQKFQSQSSIEEDNLSKVWRPQEVILKSQDKWCRCIMKNKHLLISTGEWNFAKRFEPEIEQGLAKTVACFFSPVCPSSSKPPLEMSDFVNSSLPALSLGWCG